MVTETNGISPARKSPCKYDDNIETQFRYFIIALYRILFTAAAFLTLITSLQQSS